MPSTSPRLRRSCLAVPASSERMLEKAASLPADEVFIDLEDAVAPLDKSDATRDRVVRALTAQDWQGQTLGVRVNAVNTKWCYRDILAVIEGAGHTLDI